LHHLYSPASLLGFASALGAFRATPETPHLELSSGRALKALHPSQETSLKCMVVSILINLYETQNSREGLTLADVREPNEVGDLIWLEGYEKNDKFLRGYGVKLKIYATLVKVLFIYPKLAKFKEGLLWKH